MLIQELYHAARSLRATPLFSIASVVILALGIGATTAVFSVVNGLLLAPLPVHEPDRLVRIWKNDVVREFEHEPVSYPEYEHWAERTTRFESLAAIWSWGADEAIWTVEGEARRLYLEKVSANFFDVLGVEPVYGRSFEPEDDGRIAVPPILLSYDVFRARFGEDGSIVGKTIPIEYKEAKRFEVIGVLPAAFHLDSPADVYVPTVAIDRDWHLELGCECDLIGRLRSGVAPAEARAELQAIHEQHASSDSADRYDSLEVVMTPLLDTIVGDAGTASLFLFAAVCLLLAIATVNLAGLFLTRTAKRQRELAVRAALGAGRALLIRQMLAECLLVAAAGLAGGWLVAHWGVALVLALGGDDVPRVEHIGLDRLVLGFSALLAIAATLGFGLWPALRASRLDLVHSLRGKTVGLLSTRLVTKLVVVEIAIAFVLLTASSLLVRSLLATESIDPGFRTENLLSIAVPLSDSKYADLDDRFSFHRRLRDEVEALPGVVGATPSLFRPGGGTRGISGGMRFEGQSDEDQQQNVMAEIEFVAPSYFRVMGIPIVRGRAFTDADREGSAPVVIVNESVARAHWPGEDPIGKWVEGFSRRSRVVGVSGNTRFRELRRPWQSVYLPTQAFTDHEASGFLVPRHLVVHTAGAADDALPAILARIRSLDADIPLDDVTTFEALLDGELARPRFHAFVSSLFAFVGLVLATTGIYGVVASFVGQRRAELGVRMALGATPKRLRRWIVSRGLQMSVLGLAIGAAVALPSLRLARSLFYGVSPSDVVSFVAVGCILTLVSVAAMYFPARRASRDDLLTLLREE